MSARKRSVVWSFFQAEDNKRVLCLLCMKTVLYFGHTTNMLRHLRAKHPNEFSALNKRKTTTDKTVSHHNNNGCVEVTVVMDEEQVEVQSEVGDAEMDGAIRGILCAAAGEGSGSGCDRDGTGGQGSPVPSSAPSTRKWSAVWVHYQKVEEEKKALCLLCMEKIQHQSSTSNLIRHLQNKHPAEYSQLEEHPQKRPPKRKLNSNHMEKYSGVDWCERRRLLERERELTEALRRVQQEEGRSLQQQRDFMQQIRELEAERWALMNQKREQEDEHHRLRREKEELEKTKLELQKEREALQKEREELYKAKEGFPRKREELNSETHELASGDGHLQGQVSRLYSC